MYDPATSNPCHGEHETSELNRESVNGMDSYRGVQCPVASETRRRAGYYHFRPSMGRRFVAFRHSNQGKSFTGG